MPSKEIEPAAEAQTPQRAQNTWGPILLAFVVLVVSTIVVVAASMIFRDDVPEGAGPAASSSPSASASPSGSPG